MSVTMLVLRIRDVRKHGAQKACILYLLSYIFDLKFICSEKVLFSFLRFLRFCCAKSQIFNQVIFLFLQFKKIFLNKKKIRTTLFHTNTYKIGKPKGKFSAYGIVKNNQRAVFQYDFILYDCHQCYFTIKLSFTRWMDFHRT